MLVKAPLCQFWEIFYAASVLVQFLLERLLKQPLKSTHYFLESVAKLAN